MPANKNPTFCSAEPSWANACVGNNGSPGYVEYAAGFSTAANVLIDQVISGRGLKLSVDELIYPVCFNMRHSVELRLKGAIEELTHVASKKGQTLRFDLTGSHDIGNIWRYFKHQSEMLDSRYITLNIQINSTICDIAEVDATGQVFRYPLGHQNDKHLTDVSAINFFRLKEKFIELEGCLDVLHRLNVWLREEYSQDTFTASFSRPMLYRLARELPPQQSWNSEEFPIAKKALMVKYGVSNRELSRAIEKIKNHYFLAALIGEPLPIKGVEPDQIILFLDLWAPQNPHVKITEESESIFDYFTIGTEELIRDIVERANSETIVWDTFSKILTPESLAGLHTLFYFARDRTYVERYEKIYLQELTESTAYFEWGGDNVKNSFMHVFRKSNAMDNILMSLFALGHNAFAEEIVSRYSVDQAFHWLNDARNGHLFSYPDFAMY
nr:hypothetical protein [Pseudomonas carnis]